MLYIVVMPRADVVVDDRILAYLCPCIRLERFSLRMRREAWYVSTLP